MTHRDGDPHHEGLRQEARDVLGHLLGFANDEEMCQACFLLETAAAILHFVSWQSCGKGTQEEVMKETETFLRVIREIAADYEQTETGETMH